MKRFLYFFHMIRHLYSAESSTWTCGRCGWPWNSYEWYRSAVWENDHWAHYGADPEKVR